MHLTRSAKGNRFFEFAICSRHYGEVVNEAMCKTPEIQNRLKCVMRWKIFFDPLAGGCSAVIFFERPN
jgi:hypothetical protein